MLKQLGTSRGQEAELPVTIEVEPRLYSSRELHAANPVLDETESNPSVSVERSANSGEEDANEG
jgi:hypothetical protein